MRRCLFSDYRSGSVVPEIAACLLAAFVASAAQAAPCPANIGVLGATPFTCEQDKPSSGIFLDTINFNVQQPDILVTITSSVNNITFFSLPIFENKTDAEYVADDDGRHDNVELSEFAAPEPGYHVHPQGLTGTGGGSYQLTFTATAPAILVSPVSGLQTTEGGGSAQFNVSLNTPANATVTIPVASSDTGEGTVSPDTVTFLAGASGPVAVTVTGVDDAVVDGNQAYTITLGAAQSTDARFDGKDPDDVAVTNVDLDGKIVASALTGQITEAGGQATFSVQLASAPAADVSLPLAVDKPGEAQLSPAALTFTAANGTTPQTVTVTGQDDAVTDGDQAIIITLGPAASTDPAFDGATALLSGTNLDNDIPGVVVAPTAGLVTHELGGTATFQVSLATVPAANVRMQLFVTDTTEATVTPDVLDFTPANATQTQTVTLTGVADGTVDGDVLYRVVFAPSSSTDPNYQGLGAGPVTAINEDEDTAPVTQPQNSFGGCHLVAPGRPVPGAEWALLAIWLLAAGFTRVRSATICRIPVSHRGRHTEPVEKN